uniref:G-protein coupled receptors family 1 profile domain-containing protein n=1 Tax=Astyanax mexicanus TaxID=7994 RepID=A0A3B1KAJ4_ASTMX
MGARAARNSVPRRERNACGQRGAQRPPWVATTLGCFLIFTIVVDILGNLLVIFSVYRNKKLRNFLCNRLLLVGVEWMFVCVYCIVRSEHLSGQSESAS